MTEQIQDRGGMSKGMTERIENIRKREERMASDKER